MSDFPANDVATQKSGQRDLLNQRKSMPGEADFNRIALWQKNRARQLLPQVRV